MHSDERRKAIADVLHAADAPVSASALAEKFSVSRQIIVGDIALLRSSGEEILATPRGTIGRMIGDARLYLETEQMFAWTLTVILLSLLIEYGFVALFRRFDRSARAGGDRNA